MSKRDPATDIPRRIYKSTIDRIDKHLTARPRDGKTVKKKIKMDFNKFLIEMLNLYEECQQAQVYYVNDYSADAAEARGKEILQAAKEKRKPKPLMMMIAIGEDDGR